MKKFLRSLWLLGIFLGASTFVSAQSVAKPSLSGRQVEGDTSFTHSYSAFTSHLYLIVEWYKSSEPNKVLKRDSLTTVRRTTYTVSSGLEGDTWYYTKAIAHSATGTSLPSYDSSLSLLKIQKISPAILEKGVILTPTLKWKKEAAAYDYTVYIFSKRDTSSSSVIYFSPILQDTIFVVPAGVLLPNTTYYWTLGSHNKNVDISRSVAARFLSDFITVETPTPVTPTVTTPNNTVFTEGNTPVLSWAPVSGASSYCVEISTTPDFTNNVKKYCDITGTSFTVPTPKTVNARLEETAIPYYWRVASVNASGQGLWGTSNTYFASFTTGIESAVTTTSPLLSFPNPFQDVLFIAHPHLKKAEINDLKGTLLLESKESSIPTSTLSTGVYLLKIETNEGAVFHQKIVKR